MLTFRKRVGGWTLLTKNLKPQLAEMPELAEQHARLEKTIADAQALAEEQEDLRGKLRKIIRRRQELERQGEDQRHRLAAGLQSRLGFTDESLLTYGIAPRRRSRRQKATDPSDEPGAPAPELPAE